MFPPFPSLLKLRLLPYLDKSCCWGRGFLYPTGFFVRKGLLLGSFHSLRPRPRTTSLSPSGPPLCTAMESNNFLTWSSLFNRPSNECLPSQQHPHGQREHRRSPLSQSTAQEAAQPGISQMHQVSSNLGKAYQFVGLAQTTRREGQLSSCFRKILFCHQWYKFEV